MTQAVYCYTKPIFLGAGERSMAECYALHKELDRALTLLSARQQGDKDEITTPTIENIASNIFTALTGKRVTGEP